MAYKLSNLIRARFPLIYIPTYEEDRVTKYIYIPSDSFDKNSLYEFFAKYLNAMSLPIEAFDNWVSNGARDDNYPIHEVVEGKNWDSYKLKNGEMAVVINEYKEVTCSGVWFGIDVNKGIYEYVNDVGEKLVSCI